ncbi:MAG: NAD(P)/FAD-dependent oxidoreductase, partial [Actinomycetes bacterium]
VVVAVPPSGWRTISFAPALPPAHQRLQDAMPMGSVVKVQVVFDRPFWRDAGWSGLVTDDDGPFTFVVDNSQPDVDEGVLATFLSAQAAVDFGDRSLGPEASCRRRALFLDHVARVFGPDIPEPIDYFDRDWGAASWIGGGYSGVMRPGGWTSCGAALREPVGLIHWASSESAIAWTGYVDGAIESGQRAAGEVD